MGDFSRTSGRQCRYAGGEKNPSYARALGRVVCNMPFQNLPTVFYRWSGRCRFAFDNPSQATDRAGSLGQFADLDRQTGDSEVLIK